MGTETSNKGDQMQLKTGDAVVLLSDKYSKLKAGTIGIVTAAGGNLANVMFSQGHWAFSHHELQLVEEYVCSKLETL